MPVPVNATVSGLSAALLATVSAPAAAPVALGVKLTEAVQDAPAASVAPQPLVSANGAAAASEEIDAVAVPVLEMVTVCAALVLPSAWLPKDTELGDAVRVGLALPVTDMVTFCTISGAAASVTLRRRSAPPFWASSNCAPVSCTVAVAQLPVPGLLTEGPFW